MGLENEENASSTVTMPKNTESTGTRRAVTGMGMGSQIHHVQARPTSASRRCASGESASMGVSMMSANSSGPTKRPTRPRGVLANGIRYLLRGSGVCTGWVWRASASPASASMSSAISSASISNTGSKSSVASLYASGSDVRRLSSRFTCRAPPSSGHGATTRGRAALPMLHPVLCRCAL